MCVPLCATVRLYPEECLSEAVPRRRPRACGNRLSRSHGPWVAGHQWGLGQLRSMPHRLPGGIRCRAPGVTLTLAHLEAYLQLFETGRKSVCERDWV